MCGRVSLVFGGDVKKYRLKGLGVGLVFSPIPIQFLKVNIWLKYSLYSVNYMPKTMHEQIKEREEKEKGEVITLLRKQVEVERKLVQLYKESTKDIKSKAVKHLLHMISLDSRKHIDICQLVIDVLKGEDVLKEEKEELLPGLKRHIELEMDAIDKANKILRNVWIRETKGLSELIKKWRNEEKEHHTMLKKLAGKTFFRVGEYDLFAGLRSPEELEQRYIKLQRRQKLKEP